MIALKTLATDAWLDLPTTAITVEISNPLFSFDAVPGTITYPFGLPMTPTNVRELNFPHRRAAQGEAPAPEPAALYVEGLLWRVGALLFLEYDEAKGELQYQFTADAGDLASRIEGLTLPELDLGTVPLSLVPNDPDYALPMVKNGLFYGDAYPPYGGFVNYYTGGGYAQAAGFRYQAIVPMLRLAPLLRRVVATVDYTLLGAWLSLPDVQQLIVYSARAADDLTQPTAVATTVVLNRQVPALGVAELLLAVQKMFALGYVFDSQRRTLTMHALCDVVDDHRYIDRAPAGLARATAPLDLGYTLKMALPDDEQNKTLDTGWAELRVGRGKQTIDTAAGTLHMATSPELLPSIEAAGSSPGLGLKEEPGTQLLLLYDRGLQPDSGGSLYPLATWGRTTYAGAVVGEGELRWDGPAGLYERWHRPWLDFLRTATTEERLMQFRVADLLALDPLRKEMVQGRKFLWEKVSLSLSAGKPLSTARFTYRYIKL